MIRLVVLLGLVVLFVFTVPPLLFSCRLSAIMQLYTAVATRAKVLSWLHHWCERDDQSLVKGSRHPRTLIRLRVAPHDAVERPPGEAVVSERAGAMQDREWSERRRLIKLLSADSRQGSRQNEQARHSDPNGDGRPVIRKNGRPRCGGLRGRSTNFNAAWVRFATRA
jgi:hypothetical protein